MSLPNDVSTVRIVDSFIEFDGEYDPARGAILFYPTVDRVRTASDVTILKMTDPIKATLTNGQLNVLVPATNDPDVSPSGWGYMVLEQFTNRRNRAPYIILAPAGADIVLSEQTPVQPPEHLYRQVLSVNGEFPDANGNVEVTASVASVEWDNVEDKPTTFPPSAHTHAIADVTNLQSTLDGKEASGTSAASMAAHIAASDPHPQYLTTAEGNAAYDASGTASSAVSTHVAAADPHTQYLNTARGDVRYYTKAQVDSSLAGKANTSDIPSLADTPRYVKFSGTWPARGASARMTIFTGGTVAPSDINLTAGDIWVPESA